MTLFFDAVQLDPTYFVYIGIFVGVLVAFEGVRSSLTASQTGPAARLKRLAKQREKAQGHQAQLLLNGEVKAGALARLPLYSQVPARMQQAGMTVKPSIFLGLCLLVSGVLFAIGSLAGGLLLGFAAALLSGVVVPMSVINIVRKRRVDAFAKQLPDALDLMKRGLRVGHPLNVTIANVAHNMSDPLAGEFRIMSDQITYGDTLIDAMSDLSNRIDQEDMHYLTAAVTIQQSSGGNLATMLGTLSVVIRQRYAMRRKIKAISSEGRISAYILSGLPFIMYGGTTITSPDYYSGVQDHPFFLPMAVAVVVLVLANFFTLRSLVTFRI